ncbi:MAG: beta-eliminating lyase-related protein [Steroidobacteraceae bacterium]
MTVTRFLSDNTASICPEIMSALLAANCGQVHSYGDDEWSQRLDAAFSRHFEHEVRAFAVSTGTAANALSLATITPPYGAVLTPRGSHILDDECGACEFYSGGARLTPVAAEDGLMTPQALLQTLRSHPASVHTVQPAALSITQASECGTVYTPVQIRALADIGSESGMRLHMDGARFACAVAHLDVHPADVTWRAGVDVLSFGATKNGALAAEAVVFFDPKLAADFELRRKRAGHLISKHRFIAAQLLAYLEDDVWLRNAQRTIGLAARVAAAAGARALFPVQANAVFMRLSIVEELALRTAGFEFHAWGGEGTRDFRFVVSWDQAESDVAGLCAALSST